MKTAKLSKNDRLKSHIVVEVTPIKLDIGCGKNKRQGFVGLDAIPFPGVDLVGLLDKPGKWILHKANPEIVAPLENANVLSWPTPNSWGDYGKYPFHLPDGSVEEAHSSHFLEHLDSMERVHFFNELYRVLKPDAKATIITPHWSSCRAYGDPTHKWPPMGEFAWFYLTAAWREANAPHTDARWAPGMFNCNFAVTWGYSLEPGTAMRNQEFQQFAMQFYTEARQDMIATLVKK